MSKAIVAVAALSLAVLIQPVQAQDKPSAQELQELTEAVDRFRLDAAQGDATAQLSLGVMYAMAKMDAEAIVWYRLAAEQGLASAQLNLGVMYDLGSRRTAG